MTREEASQLLPFIKAFAEGKTIQYAKRDMSTFRKGVEWVDLVNPGWYSEYKQYRIKPEPEYVPFTFEDRELLRDKWVKIKALGTEHKVIAVLYNGIRMGNLEEITLFERALQAFEFLDGTPFGKLKQQ